MPHYIECTHLHSFRTTSGFFRAIPQHESASAEERIILDEPRKVLGTLLRIISGFRLQIWETFDHEDSEVEGVLAAAEKYDMEGALSVIRSAITSPSFLERPLRLYAITAHYGWEEEAKLASKHSLVLDIHEYAPILERIPSAYLLRLLRLHRGRSIEFENLASKNDFLFGIHSCVGCGAGINNAGSFLALSIGDPLYMERLISFLTTTMLLLTSTI